MNKLQQALKRLFEYLGVEVTEGMMSSPYNDEPPSAYLRLEEAPGFWLSSTYLHINDTVLACEQVMSGLSKLSDELISAGPVSNDTSIDVLLTVIDELEFHVFRFHPFGAVVRDRILEERRYSRGQDISFLIPPAASPVESHILIDDLARQLVDRNLAKAESANWIMCEIAALDTACRKVKAAVNDFSSDPDESIETLNTRFSYLQAAFLELSKVLLHADVALATLTRILPN